MRKFLVKAYYSNRGIVRFNFFGLEKLGEERSLLCTNYEVITFDMFFFLTEINQRIMFCLYLVLS